MKGSKSLETIAKGVAKEYKKIEEGTVGGYKKIENGVVSGYKAIEKGAVRGFEKLNDVMIEKLFTREGESLDETKARLAENINKENESGEE